ncbi:MAG: LemA family protein [Candidatus Omnitrophica bacterium]|nr:LemA family protein [Candidatus Omnitrophota bacterium]
MEANFQRLQADLGRIDRAIELARKIYNDAANKYSRHLAVFPFNFIAKVFNLQSKAMFQ